MRNKRQEEKNLRESAEKEVEIRQQKLVALIKRNRDLYDHFILENYKNILEANLQIIFDAISESYQNNSKLTLYSFSNFLERNISERTHRAALEVLYGVVNFVTAEKDDYHALLEQSVFYYKKGKIRRLYKIAEPDMKDAKNTRYKNQVLKVMKQVDEDVKNDQLINTIDARIFELEKYITDTNKSDRTSTDLVNLATISPKNTEWLWQDHIPLGNLTLLFGDGGCGKSHITLDMIATVTTGRNWLDGSPGLQPSDAVIISAEDNIAETIVPRLLAAGANVRRAHALQTVTTYDDNGQALKRQFTLSDLPNLKRELIRYPNIRLVVIDPVGAFLDGRDSHKDADIRQLLTPLKMLAEDHNIAVVMVAHVNKQRGVKAVHKIMGSMGFVNAVRSAFYVAPNPNDPDVKVVAHAKCNLAPLQPSWCYQIEAAKINENIETSKIAWLGEIEMTADEICSTVDEPSTKVEEAKELLQELLSDGNARYTDEIYEVGKKQGISERTMRRAKEDLGIKTLKNFGGQATWIMDE